MKEIMVDLETLGRRPGCKILSIGAVVFGPNGLQDEFYLALTTEDQTALHEDPETVQWWAKQSAEARRVFTEPKRGFVDGMVAWRHWLQGLGGKRSLALWGNGADFDNAILQVAHDAAGVDAPWEFWNNRCYRTLKNLPGAPKLSSRAGTYHNALDDAKTQALHAIELHRHFGWWPKEG